MYLLEIILAAKIPYAQPSTMSYFSSTALPPGATVLAPLGRRKEIGVVVGAKKISDHKLEIKRANFQLRNIEKIACVTPVLTDKQIKLALFLGQYYWAGPGAFVKMMLPKTNWQPKDNCQNHATKTKKCNLILAPTIARVKRIAADKKQALAWHSDLRAKQSSEIWQKIKNGQAPIIVGTRSAIFLPFLNLNEIIIEDPDNPNHKSWDMFPHYDSRVAAQKLSELFTAKVILKKIFEQAGFLPTELIDMRQEIKNGNFSIFSQVLQSSIKDCLAQKKQIILFINRRGAANFILCRDCGYVAKCQNCDIPLAHHLIGGQPTLLCHYCGAKEKPSSLCPACQSWRIKTVGAGTQKVEIEIKKLFPPARVLRLDSDVAPDPQKQQKIIESFLNKEADVLIATQIIFSWPEEIKQAAPALVAALSSDALLNLPDFRSGERTWQTLSFLKSLTANTFVIQAYNNQSSLFKYLAKNNWPAFWQDELETRRLLGYPPFSQIVKLVFRHRNHQKAGQEAKILAAKLSRANKNEKIKISPALPAFVPKEKGKHVWQIILRFLLENEKQKNSSDFLAKRNSLLQYVSPAWEIEVDPDDLL